MEKKTNYAVGFLLTVSFISALVFLMFGFQAVLLGLVIMTVGTLVLSIEPITSALLVIIGLLAGAYFFDPQTAAGAALIGLGAAGFGIFVLFRRSRHSAKQAKKHGLK